jgi:hypothetical protein
MTDDKEVRKPGEMEEEINELDELTPEDLERTAGGACGETLPPKDL